TAATAFDLGGPRTGFRGFVAGIGSGNSCVATAQKVDANGSPTGAWETFVGTVTGASPDTLSRDHLIVSSSGSFIDWSAEGENSSPDVFVVFSAGLGASGFGPVNFVATNQWYAPVSAPDVWAGGFCTLNAFHAAPFFVPRPLVIDQ